MGFGKMISGLFRKEEKAETPANDSAGGKVLTDGADKEDIHPTGTSEVPAGQSASGEVSSGMGQDINRESDNKSGPELSVGSGTVEESSADSWGETVTEEKILEVLSNVYDPEIPIDIVNLGLIYGIEIDGGDVRISMTMTAPGCPASTQIAGESKILIEELPGVNSVDIDLVWDPPWDPSKMSEEAQQSLGLF
jgi:metal-sulfur cluster biosynthetic enzyme